MHPSTLRSRASPPASAGALRLVAHARHPSPRLQLVAILALAAGLRVWQLNSVGFNSDEAVYSGQGAALANDAGLDELFPIFRAHPLLFQTFLSLAGGSACRGASSASPPWRPGS